MKRILLFCIILLAGWLGASHDAVAAEGRLIAVIMANSHPRNLEIHATFLENSKGAFGNDSRIYVQTPNADTLSLRNSVRKAVALGADLLVTYGSAATLAAKSEALSIPTLFVDVHDPVRLGLVSAKSQTGRKMTGVRGDAPIQALFKYFTETSQEGNLAVLYDSNSPEGTLLKTLLVESGKKKGIDVVPLAMTNPKGHIATLNRLPPDAAGLFLACSEYVEANLRDVLAFASARRLPVMTQHSGAAELGAFMVLETSAREQGEKLSEMAVLVLSGSEVEKIPMFIPRQVAFVVNLKVAKEYGIQVPFQTLSVASRVVR